MTKTIEDSGTRMTEALVPQGGEHGEVGVWCSRGGGLKGVEVAVTIEMKNHALRVEVLNRKAESVKFNGITIVSSKLTNRKKIPNNRRNN